ncbi:MAG TPA: NADH-quinone oxidoreductase subunit H [Kofleriaceae bacterium]|nr:NADH-quinone oxidoreductase subunit H [Kofleriaceae bacterium]
MTLAVTAGAVLDGIAKAAAILIVPPLLLGVIARIKARFAGRVGPPLLQPYHDLRKLLAKGSVVSRTTTWVFLAGPAVSLVAVLLAAAVVPIGDGRALWSFEGDFILLAYLLGLARYATMAAALDTGSSFEGMGAAREATFACIAEPAFVLGLLALARATGSLSLSTFLGPAITHVWAEESASLVLVAAGLLLVLLAENSRIPVDDPATHLELTMVHEVMVLDHGGPVLGVVLYGAAVKLFVFAALLVRIAIPIAAPAHLAWPAFLGGLVAVAAGIGVIESTLARLRLPYVPALLLSACLCCALALVLLAR